MVEATKPRFAVVFIMIFTVCVSVGLPSVDVLDAVYDESEAVPYEAIPLFSIAAPSAAARTIQATPSALHPKPVAPSVSTPARVRDTDAHLFADARTLSSLLCILLC